MGSVQLAAVLFCDAVRSTELLVRLGDDRFEIRRRRFDALVRRAITANRGRVVKTLGDGALALFDSPSDALAAAVAVQHGMRHEARGERDALTARIGISAGEVTVEDDDVFGTTVVEASRLCDEAPAGAVYVHAAAAALTRNAPAALRPLPTIALKGFPEPVAAYELEWLHARDTGAVPIGPELPAPLRAMPAIPFVARPVEWAQLERAWATVIDGGRQAVFVRGQPGAGKTRLAAEFARNVAADGATVLFGASREGGDVPFGPVVDAFEHLLAHPSAIGASVRDAQETRNLLQAEPDDDAASGALPGRDPRGARFQVATDLLVEAGRQAPVLFVLDDLQWAGRPTLQLLHHWLRTSAPLRCLFVATHRETDAAPSDAFDEAVADFHRLDGVERILVAGFDRDGVQAFVEAAAGVTIDAVPPAAVAVLAEQTGGNPFLLGELWRHFVETGALRFDGTAWWSGVSFADFESPATVRAVVARRIDRLPDAPRALLEIAAVIGPTFNVELLAATAQRPVAEVLEDLEPALASATIERLGPSTFRFAHAIVRRAIYDRLTGARRAALHLDVAHALEDHGVDERGLADLARHYAGAVPVADAATAVAVARRAAAAAMRFFAFEDAADLLTTVLPLAADDEERGELLAEIAAAELPVGDAENALIHLQTVIEIARLHGRRDLFATAALGYEEASWRLGLPGTDAERLVREALPLITDDATRIRALAARGRALALSGDPAASDALESAIAAARSRGDHGLLRFTLGTWFNVSWNPDRYALMLERAYELRVLCAEIDDPVVQLHCQQWYIVSLLLNAQFDGLREAVAEHTILCNRTRQPFSMHLGAALRSTIALMEGRFADAERNADEAASYAAGLSGVDVSGAYGVQMFSLRREQGRLDEIRPIVEAVARLDRAEAAWRPGLAAVYAELGLVDAARAELDALVTPGLPRVPRDALYLTALTYLADAVMNVGDRFHAAALYAALEPFQNTVVIGGHLIACYGAVDRYLGSLAETAGRGRDAERHFVRAIELDSAGDAVTWLAHSRFRYARFLARQGRRDGPRRASELLAQVIDATRAIGMPALERQAVLLATQLDEELAAAGNGAAGTPATGAAPEAAPTPVDGFGLPVALTPRELEILDRLVDGLSNAAIGRVLHISPNTAANHVRAILLKTGCANRTEVAAWAVRRGVVAR